MKQNLRISAIELRLLLLMSKGGSFSVWPGLSKICPVLVIKKKVVHHSNRNAKIFDSCFL